MLSTKRRAAAGLAATAFALGVLAGCGEDEQAVEGATFTYPFVESARQRSDAPEPNCATHGSGEIQISDGAGKVLKVVKLLEARAEFDKTIWKCVQAYETTVPVADVYKIAIVDCRNSERVINRSDLDEGIPDLYGERC